MNHSFLFYEDSKYCSFSGLILVFLDQFPCCPPEIFDKWLSGLKKSFVVGEIFPSRVIFIGLGISELTLIYSESA